jgi:ABC-type multidrug transport system ATPase subunit
VIGVSGVTVELGGRVILRNVSLNVPPGSIHVILGPNGAGKTTLVRVIAGLVRPATGKVYTCGREVTWDPPERRGLGVVFQGSPLLPLRTVADHVSYPLRARGIPRREAYRIAREIAREAGLDSVFDERLDRLSGGQRQRVALATALASSRKCLVLDEAFSNLDPAYRAELYRLLERLRGEGSSILATTHVVDDLVFLADKVWVLVGGEIVEAGDPVSLAVKHRHWYTRAVLGTIAKLASELSGTLALKAYTGQGR